MRAPLALLLALSACRLEPGAGLEAEPDGAASAPRALEAAPPGAGPPAVEPPAVEDPAVLEPAPAERSLEDVRPAPRLLIPVLGVPPGDLANTFQDARSEGRSHEAIDIPAPRGRPVVAAAAGRVARLFTSERGGLTVYVVGLDGRTVYYYAHLDAYADGLGEGDALRQGDPVGTVGDTGNAEPGDTHLHFAIWRAAGPADFWDGDPVNPYPLLTGE